VRGLLSDGPTTPQVIVSSGETPLIDGQNTTLTCTASQAVQLTWMRKSPGNLTWLQLQNVTMTTDDIRDVVVSRLNLTLSSHDDGVVYHCLAATGNVSQSSVSYTIRVQCKKHWHSCPQLKAYIMCNRCMLLFISTGYCWQQNDQQISSNQRILLA